MTDPGRGFEAWVCTGYVVPRCGLQVTILTNQLRRTGKAVERLPPLSRPRAASHRSLVSCFASVLQTSLSRAAASGSRRWASRFWRPRRASTKSVSLRCERSAIRCRTRGGSNPARRSVRPARPPARPSVACTNHASSFLEVGSASATGGAGAAEGACQTRGRGAGCAAGGVWSPCARQ